MSIKVMQLVWDAVPYQDSLLLTLLALADSANDDGFCWRSVPALAEKTRQSERNIRYLLRKLEADDAIFVYEQRGRNHTNEYQINIKYLQNLRDDCRLSGDDKPAKSKLQNLQNGAGLSSSPSSPLPSPPLTPLSIPTTAGDLSFCVTPLSMRKERPVVALRHPCHQPSHLSHRLRF